MTVWLVCLTIGIGVMTLRDGGSIPPDAKYIDYVSLGHVIFSL